MRILNDIFFYGYALLLIIAGAWGVVGARIDQRILLGLDLNRLDPLTSASVVTQYRFLRAIELGFGLFAILFKKEIYTEPSFTHLFLYTMAAGVVARLISLVLDGRPRKIFYFFIASEAIGVVLIAVYTSQLAGAG